MHLGRTKQTAGVDPAATGNSDSVGWRGAGRRRGGRTGRPSLPPLYMVAEHWGPLSLQYVSRGFTSVASWPGCHMVALGSHDCLGARLVTEDCFNKSAETSGVVILSTAISAAA